jgi:hypothetical protein
MAPAVHDRLLEHLRTNRGSRRSIDTGGSAVPACHRISVARGGPAAQEALMLRLAANTTKAPKDVIDSAVAFFGPGGTGLDVEDRADDHVHFGGGGGFVTLNVLREGRHNEVVAVTREWEADVRRFFEQTF